MQEPTPYSLYNVKVSAFIICVGQENGIFCDDFFLCVKNTFCVRTQKSWHKKHSQNTCNSQEKCLSLHSLSWKQSLYLRKRLIPIEVKSGSLWRSSLFFMLIFQVEKAILKRASKYTSKSARDACPHSICFHNILYLTLSSHDIILGKVRMLPHFTHFTGVIKSVFFHWIPISSNSCPQSVQTNVMFPFNIVCS